MASHNATGTKSRHNHPHKAVLGLAISMGPCLWPSWSPPRDRSKHTRSTELLVAVQVHTLPAGNDSSRTNKWDETARRRQEKPVWNSVEWWEGYAAAKTSNAKRLAGSHRGSFLGPGPDFVDALRGFRAQDRGCVKADRLDRGDLQRMRQPSDQCDGANLVATHPIPLPT